MTRNPLTPLVAVAATIGLLAGCTAPTEEAFEEESSAPQATVTESEEPTAEPTEEPVVINDPWSSWDGYGAVFITPDAITPESPSDFLGITFTGIENRETYDKRAGDWVRNDSWVFVANYKCGLPEVEVVVNPEFTEDQALDEATRVAEVLGRIPVGPRANVQELWIHDGWELAGGGNNAIELYSDYVTSELDWLEEVFAHEGAHASLDYNFGGVVDEAAWLAAVASDDQFISDYASDYPDSEDIAESYGAYLVWATHQQQGLFPESAAGIEAKIPARLAYFESLGPDYGPLPESCGQ